MAKCPRCEAPIDLADVMAYDEEPSTQKYYECPACHADLIVSLKIDSVEIAEKEKKE